MRKAARYHRMRSSGAINLFGFVSWGVIDEWVGGWLRLLVVCGDRKGLIVGGCG
jgi:hypothetical protein